MVNKHYVAIGEEAARGTVESTTVGFIPVMSPVIPKVEFDDKPNADFRGEETVLGDSAMERMSRKWSGSIEMPFYTEAGSTKGIVGTLLKHFFGKAVSGQNGATGQYYHMMYPVVDPFAVGNLGDKALTLNCNIPEGDTVRNWPYTGGRVKALTFEQAAGDRLKLVAELVGQKRNSSAAAIASPTFAAENLRCDYRKLTTYYGAGTTRTGTAPAYTEIGAGSMGILKPEKISLKLENGIEDAMRLAGVDYPTKTLIGMYKATLEVTIDWEDPAAGFSSVDELLAYFNAISETNFMLVWNTGTQAGTGDNHGLIIDLPRSNRMGGEPQISREKGPMITLQHQMLMDLTTAKYAFGLMLKNTSAAV